MTVLPTSTTTPPVIDYGLESGLNTQQIIQAELEPYQQPETDLQNQQTTLNSNVSEYQQINSDLMALQTDASALAQSSGWNARQATSSDTGVATATRRARHAGRARCNSSSSGWRRPTRSCPAGRCPRRHRSWTASPRSSWPRPAALGSPAWRREPGSRSAPTPSTSPSPHRPPRPPARVALGLAVVGDQRRPPARTTPWPSASTARPTTSRSPPAPPAGTARAGCSPRCRTPSRRRAPAGCCRPGTTPTAT